VTGSFAYGLSNLPVAAKMLAAKVPFSAQQLINYINLLNYEFTPAHKQALVTYYQLAHVLGLIDGVPEIEFAEVMK
jgi:chorismate dehydratase